MILAERGLELPPTSERLVRRKRTHVCWDKHVSKKYKTGLKKKHNKHNIFQAVSLELVFKYLWEVGVMI